MPSVRADSSTAQLTMRPTTLQFSSFIETSSHSRTSGSSTITGRVDELALHGGETAFRHLVGHVVAADEAEVVAGGHGISGAEGDRERLPRGGVRPRLVGGVDADGDLVLQGDSRQAAFIMFGVPSSLYVPIISTGIGNIQFFTPKFFFMAFRSLFRLGHHLH